MDCGELPADFDMANFRQDEMGDTYADYPADSKIDFQSVSTSDDCEAFSCQV